MPLAKCCCICGTAEPLAKGYAMPHLATGLVAIPTRFGPTPTQKLICGSCITDGVCAMASKVSVAKKALEPEPPRRA